MKTSENGRNLIEGFEGISLKAYLDQKGVPTIGYGHTASVKLGDTCTAQQADEWLAGDLATAEGAVNRLVKVPLNQNCFDALVSFVFNVGQGNFDSSTLLRVLNHGYYAQAANEFLRWNKVSGEPNAGLSNRRVAERALFIQGIPELANSPDTSNATAQ